MSTFVERALELSKTDLELAFGFATWQQIGGGGIHHTTEEDLAQSEKSEFEFEF